MKIEHIAIWAKDIDKVCTFYRKYFDGVVHPVYHNPAKQFTSRFVTFESGARLEVMHRPDIDAMFHVKPYEPSVAEHTCMFYDRGDYGRPMAKPEAQHEQGQHLGYAHLSFSVGSKEEVDRLTQKMSEDGIQIVGHPRTTGDGYYESVVLDPEGNRVEITV